ncbi:MAG: 4Fe-4S dicluster domain-containing protein [Candidatus Krumholzibacteriota bacterium]|nr:4Fe-4S dicluster domain-containing protein [Candidatus Krumholzibacteriota bacterium]
MRFIDSTDFERLLKKLSAEGELVVPVREEDTGKIHIQRVEAFPLPAGTAFDGFRSVESLKGFAQHLRSVVARYPSEDMDQMEAEESFPVFVIVGARGCDLKAMELVDSVQVEGDYTDPFYKIRRDRMLVIASDCTECGESCFCTLTGSNPWPEKGYDLTISKVGSGYLVEEGSERGAAILSENSELFSEPREGQEKARVENREKVLAQLKSNNKDYPASAEMTEKLRGVLNDELWNEESARCVECGACTNICPTCYCFLLFDQQDGEQFKRVMSWDSCQVTGYARMAGMGTPRPRLSDRVKHRLYHKYDYLVLSHNAVFCTGCGRCIDACSASIDMRDVFRKVKTKATR